MSGAFAEVVLFSLAAGADKDAFLTESQQSREWYQGRPEFIDSEIIEGPEGQWLGLIHWESYDAAEHAASVMGHEVDMSEYMRFIDFDSVRMLSGLVVARDG